MLNPEHFRIEERDGLRLITPTTFMACANAPWTKETVWCRSRIETVEGQIVSLGFSKFWNLGCGPEGFCIGVEDVANACERGDAYATLKVDGSLLIRSVWQGKVILRTRGAWDCSKCDNASEIDGFLRKYPALADPHVLPNESLLLEWVSPSNVIVLRYPRPALTVLGGVDHYSLEYWPLWRTRQVAEILGIQVVVHFQLDADGWTDLQSRLASDQAIEGYVIRLNGEQDLVKVKCEPYLLKHYLRSHLSPDRLYDLWAKWDKPSIARFTSRFQQEFDEETCLWALPSIIALFKAVKDYRADVVAITCAVAPLQSLSRKDAAIRLQERFGRTKDFGVAMSIWLGQEVKESTQKEMLLRHLKELPVSTLND